MRRVDYLPCDQEEANKLHEFCILSLETSLNYLKISDFESADEWWGEFRKARIELERLVDRKNKYHQALNKFKQSIEELLGEAIEIQIMRRDINETSY